MKAAAWTPLPSGKGPGVRSTSLAPFRGQPPHRHVGRLIKAEQVADDSPVEDGGGVRPAACGVTSAIWRAQERAHVLGKRSDRLQAATARSTPVRDPSIRKAWGWHFHGDREYSWAL